MKLATKYRPSVFDDVIGQEAVVRILRAMVRKGAYESSYLFSGPSGVGKTTAGRILAKAILCERPNDGNPCNTCPSCKNFDEDRHFGYRELDAASFGGKEDMVRLRDEAYFQAVGGKKILLIDECHDISRQGQDALLKQVEESPEHLVYIFCTTEPDSMKKALRDRCMEFQVSKVDTEIIAARLEDICRKEGISCDREALRLLADLSKGHVRNAIQTLEEISYLGDITVDNFKAVSKNYDEDVFSILSNLGTGLDKALEACRRIAASVSISDLYNSIIAMLGDTAKVIYGYGDFLPERLRYLQSLKDLHGYRILEFLNYLLSRDKMVDRVGLQSDIILLHYKFASNGFQPSVPEKVKGSSESFPVVVPNVSQQNQSSSVEAISHAQLSKMSLKDRSKALREQRRNHKEDEKADPERVPFQWPLLKEQRSGENSFDDKELSPEEFSRLLVGGRGG